MIFYIFLFSKLAFPKLCSADNLNMSRPSSKVEEYKYTWVKIRLNKN